MERVRRFGLACQTEVAILNSRTLSGPGRFHVGTAAWCPSAPHRQSTMGSRPVLLPGRIPRLWLLGRNVGGTRSPGIGQPLVLAGHRSSPRSGGPEGRVVTPPEIEKQVVMAGRRSKPASGHSAPSRCPRSLPSSIAIREPAGFERASANTDRMAGATENASGTPSRQPFPWAVHPPDSMQAQGRAL